METLFDTYLIVDWSSNSSPKRGSDSIWLGWTRRRGKSAGTLNPSTRAEAASKVAELLRQWTAEGDRVFVGFDFPYGYPQGCADALGLIGAEPAWRRIWKALSSRVQDAKNNANNRFQVAADLNALLGSIAFWGCPEGRACETLPTRSPHFPVETPRGSRLSQYRLTEKALRQRGKGVQEVWKVFYQGSVGGQVLT